MLIPTGTRFRSSIKIRAWIPVRCEHCEALFAYLTTKSTVGEAQSPLWIRQAAARDRAKKRAVKAMDKALRSAADATPCPKCHRYQARMTRALQSKRREKGWAFGATAIGVWLTWTVVGWDSWNGARYWATAFAFPQLLALVLAPCLVALGYIAAMRLDPLADAARNRAMASTIRLISSGEYDSIQAAGYVVAE
jgi:hypothetical protein